MMEPLAACHPALTLNIELDYTQFDRFVKTWYIICRATGGAGEGWQFRGGPGVTVTEKNGGRISS